MADGEGDVEGNISWVLVGEAEGDGAILAEGVAVGDGLASGVGSGVADGVASGTSSGVVVSAEFVLVKIVSGFRRGSSGLGAGVSAE